MLLMLVVLAMFGPGANAANLYRCLSPDGQVSYQARPCAAGERTDRTITYVPAPDSAPITTKSTRARVAAASRSMTRPRGGTMSRSRTDPCQQARARREQRLAQLGLKRTYADLSRLDEPVRAACRW